jgi:glycosyltransferase involved in cell wall biosynthesis
MSLTHRLLFFSYHCYLDSSSGAAVSARDLLAMLAAMGWQCRVLCGPHLDFEQGQSVPERLQEFGIRFTERRCDKGAVRFPALHLRQDGVPIAIYDAAYKPYQPPSREVCGPLLALLGRKLDTFRPELLLTYGGHWLGRAGIAAARSRGIPVVFWLRNHDYTAADLFQGVSMAIVPSRFTADHYQHSLGLACTVLPPPVNWSRIVCPERQGKYVTFVNPQPHKGASVFARIAHELNRQRPDIPMLVVEGRAKAETWLQKTGLDFRGQSNLYVMANTPDPRDFYGVSKLVLMPSLWPETFGRVAAEALINGIPVLASRRGGLPEALVEAGFLFDVPENCQSNYDSVPNAQEVAPWLRTIIQLWDDAEFYKKERLRCLAAARAWRPEILGPAYDSAPTRPLYIRRFSPETAQEETTKFGFSYSFGTWPQG